MAKTVAPRAEKRRVEPLEIDATVNLHRRCHKVQFKKRAPRALREIRRFAETMMRTQHVVIEPEVNQFVWAKGIRNPPRRLRLRLSRKYVPQSDGGEQLSTVVRLIETTDFANLQTEKAH